MSKKMIPSLLYAGIIASMTATPLYANTAAPEDGARESSSAVGESGVHTSKNVVLEDDGTYTINLEAYSTGSTATSTIKRNVPLDVILVMDQSGSLENNLNNVKTAARNFVNAMLADANDPEATEIVEHRVAVVGFAYGESDSNTEMFVNGRYKQYKRLTNDDYQNAFMSVSGADGQLNNDISTAINGLEASGGTNPALGLKMANNILVQNPVIESRDAQRVVVLFTDGDPGEYGYEADTAAEAIEEAYRTKNDQNALVYTVGFYENNNNQEIRDSIMNQISSNYPQGRPVYTQTWASTNYPDSGDSIQYYVDKNGEKVPVYYKRVGILGHKWVDDEGITYSWGYTTFFYKDTEINVSPTGPADSDKYYLKADQIGDLNDIFDSVISDIITPSTEVTLGNESVIRDVMEKGFRTTENTQVTYEIYKGSADKDGKVTFDRSLNMASSSEFEAQNRGDDSSSGITPTFNEQNVDIKGFNFSKNYVAFQHDGFMIRITITGVLPDEANATYNVPVYTNGEASGIYENQAVADEEGTRVSFPRPTTYLADKAYVVDYAKTIRMNADDWKLQTVKKVAGSYQNLATLADGLTGLSAVETKSGKLAAAGLLTAAYTPSTTDWDQVDKFFAFGETQDTKVLQQDANQGTKNLWSRVSVVPANSVYYEDTFVTDTETGRIGIEYTGAWTANGESKSDEYDTNAVHGHWSDTSAGDSDGTVHVADRTQGTATAVYSFTGTGTDIYSRTNLESGTIKVTVTSEALKENGKPVLKKMYIIDTKSFSSGNGHYYTVPTFSVMDLPYGKYTVNLSVTNGAQGEGRMMYYLDGIRVYNPLNDGAAVNGIDGVYDGEFNAVFHPVKNLVQDGSGVFIDEIMDENGVSKPAVGTYDHANSPANEIYLTQQQSVVIKTPEGSYNKTYVGLKSQDGKPVNVQVNGKEIAVNSTMDQYWEVTPDANGCIVIKNAGSDSNDERNLVAVTNIRTANTTYQENPDAPVYQTLSSEKALASYQYFAQTGSGSEESPTPNGGENLPGEDVEIDNDEDDAVDSESESRNWWEMLFGGIFGWFH